MKFLKQQNLSKFSISDSTLLVNDFGRAVFNVSGGLILPKGDTSQRPQVDGVRQPENAYGTIRYNSETNIIEAYIHNDDPSNPGGVWETVKSSSRTTIHKQRLGPGNGEETVFGPLYEKPTSENNIIVLVENVMQIPQDNFTIEYSDGTNPIGPNAPYAEGWYIRFRDPVPKGSFGGMYDSNVYVTIFYGYSN